ncbi:hypothetical protein HNO88_000589 [Novosphingobium chloroacetimidivorans]|uniref:DUF7847 domain-containing protein n=1 Tax=Novosphingobium chloroacetimidivorans TaxID=1428314 RepID=A0A7W7K6R6_9SPHN|nr:hypothetical protein [Novosphingobium chloroacetimidivorans]MBB4857282.1 hypothetical protein [Novosphingobium chloroacetimidivorans]
MKLDTNRAWKDASRNVTRNRDALLAVAGVFFLLPQLAFTLFYPQPEPTVGMSERQIMALAQSYYVSAMPAVIPMVLCQALGTLGLLSLLSHVTRPTVGGALRLGLAGLPTYLGAQILLGLGLALIGTLIISVLALSGVMAVAVAGLLLVLLLAIAIALRVSLSAAVVAIEGERNPVRALRRSWLLTSGNAWRLLGFYALFFVAFLVILMIASLVVNIPLALVASGWIAELGAALVSAVLSALFAVYLVAVIEAVHHQLAGDPVEAERRTFE